MSHLHIFRRDYRLQDNNALYSISDINELVNNQYNTSLKHIIPLFIFTPQQVTSQNKYKSTHAIQFMIRSLRSLDAQLRKSHSKLLVAYGDELAILKTLHKRLASTSTPLVSVSWNKDYTPYSVKRDNKLAKYLQSQNIICETFHDLYLIPPLEGIVYPASKTADDVYTVFTPFYRNARNILRKHPPLVQSGKLPIPFASPATLAKLIPSSSTYHISLEDACRRFVGKDWSELLNVEGGRENGEKRLQKIKRHQFSKYDKERDQLTYETTYLSAYLKFGCVSVREAFHAMAKSKGDSEAMIRELIWRDYYAHVMAKYPHVIGKPFYEKYERFPWETSRTKEWNAWKEGRTGFPVVDAGMRQMNTTGYMHNRCRMIVSSFLVKLLRIDWRRGEKYFAQTLEDYDVASNNGGWQDAFGSGAGAQPYYRIFNPWTQAKKFDKDAEYIRRWVPELKDVPADVILNWDNPAKREKARETYGISTKEYPEPVIDYAEERAKTLKQFKSIL